MCIRDRFSIWFKSRKPNRDVVDDVETWSENDQHIYFDQSTPRHKLSLMWSQRSVDTFLGLPFNIASYAFLLHMIAQQVNMVPHELIGSLGDTHLYNNHLEQVEELLSREPMELPTLELEEVVDIFSYSYEDFKILNYSSHPAIKAPLSN